MENQLTVDKLIEFLEKVRKNHGGNVPVYHVECGAYTKSERVSLRYIDEDKDGNPIVSLVIDAN